MPSQQMNIDFVSVQNVMAFRHTVNLGNSIVGVSLLSMPYCFRTSGIILSILTIIISSYINRFACHLILKSARLSKRRTFENLAFSVFGITGKLVAEIAILGFLLGSCVAFFVVIGDLCPSLITQLFDMPNYTHLRTFTMMFLGMFIALPLALKRRVEASFSAISMFLYLLLAINLFTEAFTRLTFEDDRIFNKLNYWSFDNYFRVLPIFITCLSCQPQLFEVFDHSLIFSEEKHALARLNKSIKQAIFICSLLYISVGFFGYLVFFESDTIEGNLLIELPHSLFSVLAKLGFLFTIVLSLPLCLFPCRTSLHSLIYGRPTSSLLNEMTLSDSYIPDDRWLLLTVLLLAFTICISIILPHIEFILGLVGSTTGAIVCLILPTLFFINLSPKQNVQRFFTYVLLYFGIILLFFSTFSLINVDPQELSSEGQIIKNLNLSTNRIEKLIKQNDKLDQKNDLIKDSNLKDELKELNLDDFKFKKLKSDELNLEKSKPKETNEFRAEKLKSNESKVKVNELKLNESKSIELKNNVKENKPGKEIKSGFINAVEMKKKSLNKEKSEVKVDRPSIKPVNQTKPESTINETRAKNLSNKTVDDKKAFDKSGKKDSKKESKNNVKLDKDFRK